MCLTLAWTAAWGWTPLPLAAQSVGQSATQSVGHTAGLLSPGDPLQAELEELVGLGLVDTVVVGQRPWSVDRAVALARQARTSLHRLEAAPILARDARALLDRVDARLVRMGATGRPRGAFVDRVRIDASGADARARGVPANGLGSTSALLAPLHGDRQGRERIDGTGTGVEVGVRARPAPWIELVARPRVASIRPRNADGFDGEVTLREAYARAVLGNAAVTVGRAPLVWGPAPGGGLLLSENARPLLRAGVATATPVELPWLLGALGPGRHELFLADMGTDGRAFPHAVLVGLRSSFRVHPRVEIGLAVLNQQGGEGAPGASLVDRIADVLVIPDLFITDRDFVFSQKLASVDVEARFPGARGMRVWLEWAVDDFDRRRIGSVLADDSGWSLGFHLPRLDPGGRLSLEAEARRTGLRFYSHADFAGGLTVDRRLLGSELGPDGDGLRARLGVRAGPRTDAAVEATWERRSADRYRLLADEPPHGFVRTASLPEEDRWRLVVSADAVAPDGRWTLAGRVGVERVLDFGFRQGVHRTGWIAAVSLVWEPAFRR